MSFAAPYFLIGLVAVPLAIIGYLALDRRRAKRSAAWSRHAMLPNLLRWPARGLRYLPAALFLLGLTSLLVGFARPQRFSETSRVGGATVTLLFDVSGSMASTDVGPTRLQAARDTIIRFLREMPARYRVAVVTFADAPHVVVEPTFDRGRVIAKLPGAVTPLAGTAIGDAMNQALAVTVKAVGKSVPGDPFPPGAILLVSDGAQTNVGTRPQDAAQLALAAGIPIDTLVVGTRNGVVVQPLKPNDPQSLTQTIPVPVSSTTLQEASQITGGRFFASLSAAPLSKVYENLGTHTRAARKTHELNVFAAAAALVLILAGVAVSGLWFGRVA